MAKTINDFLSPDDLMHAGPASNALDYLKNIKNLDQSLDDQILGKVSKRLGLNANGLIGFAEKVAGMESDNNSLAKNPITTAKGSYQFTNDSFITAKKRLKNIIGQVPKRILDAKSIIDLSPEDQRALFFAHLTEDKGSDERMKSYLEGKNSGWDLYLHNHYKGLPTPGTLNRKNLFFP